MKNSIWLQQYEKEVNDKRQKSNQGKKVIFIIIPIMALLCIAAALANGGAADPQAKNGMMFTVITFAFIMIFAMIMANKGKKMDVTKETRENVLALLKTDEDVDCFDRQMKGMPVMEEKIAAETTVFLTTDYVGMRFLYLGNLQYRFARRNDITALDYCKTASAGANPLKASYFFDVKDAGNEKLLGGTAETGSQLEKLEALLKAANPNLVVTKKRGI